MNVQDCDTKGRFINYSTEIKVEEESIDFTNWKWILIIIVVNFVFVCTHSYPYPHALPTPTEATDQGVGGRHELKSVPFISYLSALQKSQLLSDDIVNGVEIRCEEKGSCPAGCHLCHHQAMMGGVSGRAHSGNSRSREQPSPIPVLLEVSRVVPLYSLVQDNVTKEVSSVDVCVCLWICVQKKREEEKLTILYNQRKINIIKSRDVIH